MKSLFLAIALLAISAPAFADWKFQSVKLTEKGDLFAREAGIKLVNLTLAEPSCVPVTRYAKEMKLERIRDNHYSVRVIAETNDEAMEREGMAFGSCDADYLQLVFDVKDGTYDLEIDGKAHGSLVVKGQEAKVVK